MLPEITTNTSFMSVPINPNIKAIEMFNIFMVQPSFERCSEFRNLGMEILLNFTFVSAATRFLSELRVFVKHRPKHTV